MTQLIHISEITPERWIDTSFARGDGKLEFRERPRYGNRHAAFSKGAVWGEIHIDEHNALDFPDGTVNHLAKYTEEKTSIPQDIAKLGIILGGLFAGYKLLKFLEED